MKTKILCFFLSFLMCFMFVCPLFVSAASGDSWHPNDENHDGVIDENDIIIYCAKNGYVLNEEQFKRASNNLTWVKTQDGVSMITELPTNLMTLVLYLVDGNSLEDLSQSNLEDVWIEYSQKISTKTGKSISDLNNLSQIELVEIVSNDVFSDIKSDLYNGISNLDNLLGYIILPIYASNHITTSLFANTNQYDTLNQNIYTWGASYINSSNSYADFFDVCPRENFYNYNYVAHYEETSTFQWKDYIYYARAYNNFIANGGSFLFLANPSLKFCPYDNDLFRVTPSVNGSDSLIRIRDNGETFPTTYYYTLEYYDFYVTTGDNPRRGYFFVSGSNKDTQIVLFKSNVELRTFKNGESFMYNVPSMIDIDWSDFPYDAFDFSDFSEQIINAIKENESVSAQEIQEIIENLVVDYLENIDVNTAEMVKLLRSGLFDEQERAYLKLILQKLDSLDFSIDAADIELNVDLSSILSKLDTLDSDLTYLYDESVDIFDAISSLLDIQLEISENVYDIHGYLQEVSENLDTLLYRLESIDTKLSDTNSKLSQILIAINSLNINGGSPLPFDPSAPTTEISTDINDFIALLFPLTTQETMKTKFPFSIPFTLGALINLFDAEPSKPTFDYDFTIMGNDVNFQFEFPSIVDDFVNVFQIFVKIGFCGIMIKLSKEYISFFNDLND